MEIDKYDKHLNAVAQACFEWESSGYIVALVNGCFDPPHVGHADLFYRSHDEVGGALGVFPSRVKIVVAVNSDESVRALKGPHRPVSKERHRVFHVGCLRGVDRVFPFPDLRTTKILRTLTPSVVVRSSKDGCQLHPDEAEVCSELGIKVLYVKPHFGVSSSGLIAKVAEEYA